MAAFGCKEARCRWFGGHPRRRGTWPRRAAPWRPTPCRSGVPGRAPALAPSGTLHAEDRRTGRHDHARARACDASLWL
nr:unnamed protein product [Digitaria exilis]